MRLKNSRIMVTLKKYEVVIVFLVKYEYGRVVNELCRKNSVDGIINTKEGRNR